MPTRILPLTRDQVVSRALAHLTLVAEPHPSSPPDFVPAPVAYRLDDSGRLGGDDPSAPHCADWSYGYRTLTADCIGFALYCAGLSRYQPGYAGLNGSWLNTDSLVWDANGPMKFVRPVFSGEKVLPGDFFVTTSKYTMGIRREVGHIGIVVRPKPSDAHEHLLIDCSPFHGRTTAIGLRKPWSVKGQFLRPLHYKETP